MLRGSRSGSGLRQARIRPRRLRRGRLGVLARRSGRRSGNAKVEPTAAQAVGAAAKATGVGVHGPVARRVQAGRRVWSPPRRGDPATFRCLQGAASRAARGSSAPSSIATPGYARPRKQLIEAEQIYTAVGHRLRFSGVSAAGTGQQPRSTAREPRAELSSTPSAAAIHPSRAAKLTITGYDHNSRRSLPAPPAARRPIVHGLRASSVTITMSSTRAPHWPGK